MKGNSPLFGPKTSVAVGDINLPSGNETFFANIARRKEIDVDGFLDVSAHGSVTHIQIKVNGRNVHMNWRALAQLIKRNKQFHKNGIRLLSCNTGSSKTGFAQNLANKLGVPVKAPDNLLWAYPNGKMIIAPGMTNDKESPDYHKPHPTIRGKFITYYPGGKQK